MRLGPLRARGLHAYILQQMTEDWSDLPRIV